MEGKNEETPQKSPVVETIGKKVWEAVVAIPVEKEWADKMRSIAGEMTARKFSKAQEMLYHNADAIGKTAQVAAATLDVTLAVGCGAGVIKFGVDMKKNTRAIKRVEDNPQLGPTFLENKPDFIAKNSMLKKNAFAFGGLGGALLVVRPASRLAYYSAKWGFSVAERVVSGVNAILLRSEKPL